MMENLAEIMKLIEAGLQEDQTKVVSYTQLLISKLESAGELDAAEKIRRIVKRNKTLSLKSQNYEQVLKSPVDAESRLPLAEIKQYPKDSVFLSVDKRVREDIQEFINLINQAENFFDKGIKINRSLLLFGPPGTGKTQAAKYISAQTNLPLVTVRIDGMVSSYLGSTSKNIRTLFDFVEKMPCILFLDEFDAIAKMRDDSNELGELKRVVNSLLQNIDSVDSKVPVIAATNHEHLLDSAVWRRFDYKLRIDLPDKVQREYLVNEFLTPIDRNGKSSATLIALTNKFTGAEIEAFCNQIRTGLIMNNKLTLSEADILNYYIKFKNRNNKGTDKTLEDNDEGKLIVAKSLRQHDEKTFTIRHLSEICGISTGKLSQSLKDGDMDG